MKLLSCIALLGIVLGGPAMAQNIDFGDDSGDWANDGECDDPRFEGPGMTATPLLDEDILRDATDCRTAFEAGQLSLRGERSFVVNFGDDNGEWSNDGECDDPRFEGPGMTQTPLLVEDVLHDATDCEQAFVAGRLTLRGVDADGAVDFGDDSGEWANDGECDDMRFKGAGMTATPLLFEDIMTDATDCKTAYDSGRLTLVGQ